MTPLTKQLEPQPFAENDEDRSRIEALEYTVERQGRIIGLLVSSLDMLMQIQNKKNAGS